MRVCLDFEHNPLEFSSPLSLVGCYEPSGLKTAFSAIESALARGYYVAGFLSYEAGYGFEPCLPRKERYDFPLVMMGVYERPAQRRAGTARAHPEKIEQLQLAIARKTYDAHIDRIRGHIAAGDVYQITYCIKFGFRFRGDPLALYTQLLRRQPVPYPAYIDTGRYQILSLSPERFFKKSGSSLVTEPMKGTWQRGRTFLGDQRARSRFQRDPKNRAENLMICDLLRNDLGRIGGDVEVPALFTVTAYETLFQMTSTVTARTRADIPVYELFSALFPSGSVTGAPKIRAMQVIHGLEAQERKIYTGAIGYISPGRDMYFNVPIRTLLLEGDRGEMGVGGGIVWDSTAQGEWEEGLLKASFLL